MEMLLVVVQLILALRMTIVSDHPAVWWLSPNEHCTAECWAAWAWHSGIPTGWDAIVKR